MSHMRVYVLDHMQRLSGSGKQHLKDNAPQDFLQLTGMKRLADMLPLKIYFGRVVPDELALCTARQNC